MMDEAHLNKIKGVPNTSTKSNQLQSDGWQSFFSQITPNFKSGAKHECKICQPDTAAD